MVLAAGAAGFVALRRGSGLEQIYYEPQGMRFRRGGVRLTHVDAVMKMAVSNPSDVELRVQNWYTQYFFSGIKLGESRWENQQIAGRRQTAVFEVPVRLSTAGLLQAGFDVVKKWLQGQPFRIDGVLMTGKATVNGLDLDIDYYITIQGDE
ncbi:MAG: LEA type 2 family protein [Bacteroidia bacterium]|nr:LEA type 2 family protein [Bacteroidia bacterium]